MDAYTSIESITWVEVQTGSNTRRRFRAKFYPYSPRLPYVALTWMPIKKLWRLTRATARNAAGYATHVVLAEYIAPTTQEEAFCLAEAHITLKGFEP